MQKYNGQLIRQFASIVSGNAASGVTVTVRRQSDGGIAMLYVENNIAGATLSNPLTTSSTGHFAFYAPDDVYTLTFSDTTPAQVIQLQDVGELQSQFDAAVLAGGYIPSGTFAAGATLTQANQVLSDGSSYWRWDGSFPKVVTAGGDPTPTGVGGWIVVSDFALRGDLEDVDSTVLIAGVEAKAFRAIDGVKNLIPVDNAVLNVTGFYAGSTVGGGQFKYVADMSNVEHNGGTVIAASALAAWNGTGADIATLLNWSGAGFGCYVRVGFDKVSVTYFGALPYHLGGGVNQQTPINKALSSFSGKFAEVHLPSGVFYVSDKITMFPAVTLEGEGAEATWLTRANGVTSDSVVSAEFINSGADYIYIRKLTVSGNKQNGGVGKGVVFDNVHVPSYLDDVTVLWCSQANIEIKKSTVIQLSRVWSNGGLTYALDIDSVRSLHILGGAYEHSESGTAHIRIRNTHNYYYPQATITAGHVEGLLVAGMSGIEVGGGSEYYSVQGLAIQGLQTLGKRVGGESNNYALSILDDNCQITVSGESHTGLTSFVRGAKVGAPVPPPSAFSISNWHYIGNSSSGYNMPANEMIDSEGESFKVISQQSITVPAFSQTEQGVVIPTQPNTDYNVYIQVGGYMGNNVALFVAESDKTNSIFKIKFINTTTGAASQLSDAVTFKILVTR